MSNVITNHQQSKPEGASHLPGSTGNPISKLKEVISGLEEDIKQYEKAKVTAVDHLKFLEGNIAGLRRSLTALEIFFHSELKGEVPNA